MLGVLAPVFTLAFAFTLVAALSMPFDTPNARRLWFRVAGGLFLAGFVVLLLVRATTTMDDEAAVENSEARGGLAAQVLLATLVGAGAGQVFGTTRGRRLEEARAQKLRDRMPVAEPGDGQRDIHPVLAASMSDEDYEAVRAYNERVAREKAEREQAERDAREAERRNRLRRSNGGSGPGHRR